MKTLAINLHEAAITKFCEQNHIRKLSLFGSVLRDDFNKFSNIDVLVEFQPGKTPGLAIVPMQDELSQLWRRPVDLRTPAELSR
jgi:predicted nucleotidyltransferase